MGGIDKVTLSPPKSRLRNSPTDPSDRSRRRTQKRMQPHHHRECRKRCRMGDAPLRSQLPSEGAQPFSVPRWPNKNGTRVVRRKHKYSSRPQHASTLAQALPTLFFRKEVVQSIEGKNDRIERPTRKFRQV